MSSPYCAGFEATAIPAGLPTLLAVERRQSGSRRQDRPGASMQFELRVPDAILRRTGVHARRQLPGNETSQRLLPIQLVFRTRSQLPLQGFPQIPVRHRPRVRRFVIGLVYFHSKKLRLSAIV